MLSELHSLRKAEPERADDVWSLAIGALDSSDVATVGHGVALVGLGRRWRSFAHCGERIVSDADYSALLFGL